MEKNMETINMDYIYREYSKDPFHPKSSTPEVLGLGFRVERFRLSAVGAAHPLFARSRSPRFHPNHPNYSQFGFRVPTPNPPP